MSNGKSLVLLYLCIGLYSSAALTQEIASPHKTATPRINLDVVVTPKSGPAVTGLQQQDFTILDNKVAQPVTSFKEVAGGQAPISVILVIDAVNTSYQEIAYERGELKTFLLANDGQLQYPTALAIMSDNGTQIQEGFSQDGKAMNESLEKFAVGLRSIRQSAGVYGADERFQISLRTLRMLAAQEASRPGRKIVLWASPGWPLLSGPGIQLDNKQQQQLFSTIVDLSTQLRLANITLYAVNPLGATEGVGRTFYYQQYVKGVSKSSQTQIADLSLQVLATQTGGVAINSTDIAGMLQQCLADTKNYYEVSFDALPAERADEYHHIEVHVAKPGLTARTREGYYAQP
ncbi:hypothetical protein ACPOL_3227 [Acidisarcina polymorpha]|uniref:VWFA domain-containing protein n=1 Tax=Acidisarcina polymorpha TaxID=2211140 RepID=A0A2Z5G0A3_9BACT|nr:VWA domain-containing protein [Acidisarcina polymorpha]AXC12522.1 hypothetical protein ACPOL_3227 [Acidisarcina polymorpha]